MRKRVWKLGKGRSCNVHLDLTDHITLHHSNWIDGGENPACMKTTCRLSASAEKLRRPRPSSWSLLDEDAHVVVLSVNHCLLRNQSHHWHGTVGHYAQTCFSVGCFPAEAAGTSELLAARTRQLWWLGGLWNSKDDSSDQSTSLQSSAEQSLWSLANLKRCSHCLSVNFGVLLSLNGLIPRLCGDSDGRSSRRCCSHAE